MTTQLVTDAAAEQDLLDFSRYTTPLLPVLVSSRTQTPLAIGIFGPWGSGKTTLLGLLKATLTTRPEYKDQVFLVEFSPWIHRGEPNLLIPLLHTLADALATWGGEIKESAQKIADCLLRIGANLFLKSVTAGTVSLKDLKEIEKEWLDTHKRSISELRGLRQSLADVAAQLEADAKKRLVITIDDLDRCDPLEIVMLLEAIKLFLDVPNVITVLAVDTRIVHLGIEARYREVGFPPEVIAGLGSDYLEKIVQVPIYLHPLRPFQIRALLDGLDLDGDVRKQLGSIEVCLLPNPRKIKRIINLVSAAFVVAPAVLDKTVLTKLVVLQVQRKEIYAQALEDPDFLFALEDVYANGTLDIKYESYRHKHARIREFCACHFEPGGELSRLFIRDQFAGHKDTIYSYLNLLPAG